jgi:hypothetical protein
MTPLSTQVSLPNELDEAIAQAQTATQAALAAGYTRLQVEILIPELKMQPVAQQFIQAWADLGPKLRIFFPDPGAAALARRDWGEIPYPVRGIEDVKAEIQPEESLFIFIEPSSVELEAVEKLCREAGERPVVFLNPTLVDVVNVGVGYAARQMRDRFLNSLTPCYYLKPLDQALLFHVYAHPWQLWLEAEVTNLTQGHSTQTPSTQEIFVTPDAGSNANSNPDSSGDYQLIAEFSTKPDLETIAKTLAGPEEIVAAPTPNQASPGLLGQLQRLLGL